ncbi:acyl-CoA Delta-4 desaturase-like [Melanotaenia boesemani]|uniref:acyl-CoA Delta-4 desaturase-like n=1 Tax=Melanotaenia boesemani TaxID=1250792 RepID=UPI001C03F8BC|nr:acyl-CoA Delta-4 desaturase-like [Melanotaenia boesemani]XP_041852474.1 acyl-CoA Delta-4 desaturase-like [Melanotaenia boesemani]XP_041852475.1 acyl-CoA Delta-4 desaturase-like [Melanotaenia boesemani]XP_041852476.1 acyl-CoA Delta-4 desaturase-like [Melanotaenia boesemani]
MGGGGQQTDHGEAHSGGDAGVYTWEEVQKHNSRKDQWLVINRKVYNITQWAKRHPGGFRLIGHYAGEDATEAFNAFHPDQKFVQKFLKPLLIGELKTAEPGQDHRKNAAIIQDFDTLRVQAEKQGLFQAKPLFFCLHLGHIMLLEALAYLMVLHWGTSWMLTFLCAVMLATAQAQAGWLQHDFGHLSVFKKSRWNHLIHKFVIGQLKGASANWWNHRHFQHHAKPNVFMKDPDIHMLDIFVLGATQPVEYGIKKIKHMPYNHQHQYFFLVAPPLLIPVFYNLNIIKTIISRRDWVDLAWYVTYYFRFFYCFIPLYGAFGSLALATLVRFLESHWFVWVTQMSHLPMEIDNEKHQDWMTMQLLSTCNIEQSFFNDWFSGHLNFQIEHHLFPRMPRHNYHLVAPQVRALCKKHGIPYEVKTLYQGMADVVRSLKTSGDLWLDAYLHK